MKGKKSKKERKEKNIYTLSFKQWYNKGELKNQDKTGTTWRKKLNIYITKITKPKKKGKHIRVFSVLTFQNYMMHGNLLRWC